MPAKQLVAVALMALVAAVPPAGAGPVAPVDDYLSAQLRTTASHQSIRVLVHAQDVSTAARAAESTGLRVTGRLPRIGVVIATGPAGAVRQVRAYPGVTFVEGDRPVVFHLDSSHTATRGAEARTGSSAGVDGSGTSIAIVDTGIDGTHPFFLDAEGESKVVRNVRTICPFFGFLLYHEACFIDEAARNDSDALGLGGHGTHVAGIAAGYDVTTTSPRRQSLHGAAPGAKLVGISVSAGPSMAGAVTGLYWALENQANPCAAPRRCPPIKVVNNSWGSLGGSRFCEQCAETKTQRALVEAGVVVVWSAGNDGGDGSGKDELGQSQWTNGDGADPTPGVLLVASYDDGGTGTRDGKLSGFSSRGVRGDQKGYPDLSAPGSSILSSCRPWLPLCYGSLGSDGPGAADRGTFSTKSGTSMSAPHIAGIVAQLFEANPSATPAQVEWALVTSAKKFGDGYERSWRWDTTTSFDKGHGLVDVVAAVRAIRSRSLPSDAALQPPSPEPEPEESAEDDPEPTEDPRPRDR